ncbi:hypothetical protein J6590_046677 [Homalodisca vitripennis]|nr:hypothetical protein J6590_046677 [Homalodisca vitripennis]
MYLAAITVPLTVMNTPPVVFERQGQGRCDKRTSHRSGSRLSLSHDSGSRDSPRRLPPSPLEACYFRAGLFGDSAWLISSLLRWYEFVKHGKRAIGGANRQQMFKEAAAHRADYHSYQLIVNITSADCSRRAALSQLSPYRISVRLLFLCQQLMLRRPAATATSLTSCR